MIKKTYNYIKDKVVRAWKWTKTNVKKVLIGIGVVGVVTAATIVSLPPQVPDIAIEKMSEKYNQAQEIKAKYQMNGASLKRVAKADPKDRIEVIVGNEKGNEFIPKVEIQRWDNEVSFSVELKDTETGNPTLNFEGEKIKWSKGNIDIEYYEYTEGEGGYKMVWFLKEKPLTNIVEFTLQSKGLDFHKSPILTEEEISERASNGDNINREAMGSYAIYHNGNPINYIGGKEYKIGKFGQIYGPKLIDANGKEELGDLFIDVEKGIYRITIPQEFLDNAVYPIRSNDNFGWETKGETGNVGANGAINGFEYSVLGADGDVTSMTAWVYEDRSSAGKKTTWGIYNSSDGLEGDTEEWIVPVTYDNWKTINIAAGGELTAGDYYLVWWCDYHNIRFWYDQINESDGIHYDNETYDGSWPDPWANSTYYTYDRRYSLYATYDAAAAGTRVILWPQ